MRNALSALGLCVVLSGLSGLSGGLWFLAPAVAHAQSGGGKDEARAHFATGEARFKAGDYIGAIKEFRAADQLVPSPILTYNVALCYDKLGDTGRALARYREYLDRRPEAPNRAQVETRIAALSVPNGGRRAPPPVAAVPPVPGAPAPEGDGLAPPRAAAAPTNEPRQRAYDDTFARRLPTRAPEEASAGPAPGMHGDAEQGPPIAMTAPPGPPSAVAAPVGLPPPETPPGEAKPVYKQWWFWAIIGVGTIIVIDVAVNAGSSSSSPSGPGRTTGAAPAPRGLALFHF